MRADQQAESLQAFTDACRILHHFLGVQATLGHSICLMLLCSCVKCHKLAALGT